MSVMRIETILCDFGEDCETEPPFAALKAYVTRMEALKVGWTHPSLDVDFCPKHSAALAASPASTTTEPVKPALRCTCPLGDGSLRWPCPSHPPIEDKG